VSDPLFGIYVCASILQDAKHPATLALPYFAQLIS